jgi:hypothetical protein
MADQNTPNKQAGEPVGQFGDPLLQANFDSPDKKKNPEYGRTLLSRIFKEQNNQASTFYFGGRNIRWMENWGWAMGRQSMNEFTDYVSMEGNKAYAPVDMTQNRIGPQFLGVLIDSMSQNDEYPCVTAIDPGSLGKKDDAKWQALFRMHEVETMNDVQQQAGIQLEPTNAYVPDDPYSAEVYFKLEHRLPEEIEFEEYEEKVMGDNLYKQKSRQTKKDLIVLNCGITKIEKDDNGFIGIRKVTPANSIYNFFTSDSGQLELSYIGECYSLKIKDLRNKYGKSDSRPNGLSEKDIFEMARTANQFNNANRFVYYWNESYMYAIDRPYDDYGVQVFDCEIQCFDADYYVSKQDNFGKENIQPKKGIPQPTSGKATVIKKDKLTVYRGIWAVKSDKMIYWGLPDLVIKPFMNISQSLFSYSIQIPNNDGDYVPSLFERGLSPLRKWTLSDLKIKQIIGTIAPPGISIDIETIRDIDLGDGKTISPLEVIKIRNQTGNVIWSSKGLNPNDRQDIPIKELSNSASFQQLTELVNVKNDSMQELRSVWGVPLYRDGSDLPPRMGQAVVENQNANANNVTDYINFADKCLWEETLYKVALLHWDDVVINQQRTELMDTEFQVKLELKPTIYEQEKLKNRINIAMQTVDPATGKPLITLKDAIKIENIKNFKLAEMYLANVEETNMKRAAQDKDKREQANIQSQQQSAQMANEQAMQIQQAKLDQEKEMLDYKSTKEKEFQVLVVYGEIASKGLPIPPFISKLTELLYPNIAIPLGIENDDMEKGMQAKAMEDRMEQNQQAQPPAQPQPNQMQPQQPMPQAAA